TRCSTTRCASPWSCWRPTPRPRPPLTATSPTAPGRSCRRGTRRRAVRRERRRAPRREKGRPLRPGRPFSVCRRAASDLVVLVEALLGLALPALLVHVLVTPAAAVLQLLLALLGALLGLLLELLGLLLELVLHTHVGSLPCGVGELARPDSHGRSPCACRSLTHGSAVLFVGAAARPDQPLAHPVEPAGE